MTFSSKLELGRFLITEMRSFSTIFQSHSCLAMDGKMEGEREILMTSWCMLALPAISIVMDWLVYMLLHTTKVVTWTFFEVLKYKCLNHDWDTFSHSQLENWWCPHACFIITCSITITASTVSRPKLECFWQQPSEDCILAVFFYIVWRLGSN